MGGYHSMFKTDAWYDVYMGEDGGDKTVSVAHFAEKDEAYKYAEGRNAREAGAENK